MKQLVLFSPEHREDRSQTPQHQWRLYVDGASRNNPGPSGAGIYLLKDNMVIEQRGYFLGLKTNNEAEYLALILGLLIVRDFITTADEFFIISDSQLLVRQLQGSYKVKMEHLRRLHTIALQLVRGTGAQITHVLRAENSKADELANMGVDKKEAIPAELHMQLKKYEISI